MNNSKEEKKIEALNISHQIMNESSYELSGMPHRDIDVIEVTEPIQSESPEKREGRKSFVERKFDKMDSFHL